MSGFRDTSRLPTSSCLRRLIAKNFQHTLHRVKTRHRAIHTNDPETAKLDSPRRAAEPWFGATVVPVVVTEAELTAVD